MKIFSIASFALLAQVSGEGFPELPTGVPIEKTMAWEILDKQWKIIEPILFSMDGQEHLGRSVRFSCKFRIVGDGIEVTTPQGTKAIVTRVPKTDMKLLKKLRESDSNIVVEGKLVKIDQKAKIIEVEGGGIRAGEK